MMNNQNIVNLSDSLLTQDGVPLTGKTVDNAFEEPERGVRKTLRSTGEYKRSIIHKNVRDNCSVCRHLQATNAFTPHYSPN